MSRSYSPYLDGNKNSAWDRVLQRTINQWKKYAAVSLLFSNYVAIMHSTSNNINLQCRKHLGFLNHFEDIISSILLSVQFSSRNDSSIQTGINDQLDFSENNRIRENRELFKCDNCSIGFSRIGNLKRHNRIHTGEKPFKCDKCDLDVNQSNNLKAHQRKHADEKPIMCNECSLEFNHRSHLKTHRRSYTDKKSLKCDTCSKKFSSFSSLNKHYRIHTDEKPFECDECDMKFNQPSNLRNHLRQRHTGEKPFNTISNKRFGYTVCAQYSSTTPYSIPNTGDIWSPRRQLTSNKYAT
ncbi:hypothetical protein DINM_004452 [Dirofilaria immitis]|nr:hypothetical protein [Dirofilaria immitis]